MSLRLLAARFGVAMVSLLLALAAAEGLVRALDLFAEARGATEELPDPEPMPEEAVSSWVLHPFLGWVRRPGVYRDRYQQDSGWLEANARANTLGYNSAIEDYRDLREDDLVVGIFGGSVAHDVVVWAGDELVRRLEQARPELAGRVWIINGGQGAHKQPQQLLGLIQMRLLEVPLDMVVNLDGFNEVALSIAGIPRGQHPIMPSLGELVRAYGGSQRAMNQEQVLATAKAVRLKQRAEAVLRWLHGGHPVARSELVRAALGNYVRWNRHERRLMDRTLRRSTDLGADKMLRIPDPCFPKAVGGEATAAERFDCLELVAEVWRQSSLMMARVAEDMGAGFLHVLQPNQHVPGSKPLTAAEQELADTNFAAWTRAVVEGYPQLQAAGRELALDGVAFADLTSLFESSTETLYRDSCCHFNAEGNRLLAGGIADLVEARLGERQVAGHP